MFFVKKESESLVSESYRNARINLQYILKKGKAKSVLITSAEKNDGKTTVVKNLALSFASIDKSVIVIDCDFRTSKLSELFGVKDKVGISDVIVEKEKLKFAIVQRKDNISILSSGTSLYNLDGVICSNKMAEILNILKETYDVIIIDSPAVNQFADAQILSQATDYTALVVKAGISKGESVLEGKRILESVGAKICGSILVNK